MKRSEMVNLFADYLAANYDESWNEQKDHVSTMLAFLEIIGMLPPKRYTNEAEEPSDPKWHGLNDWEPEDESR